MSDAEPSALTDSETRHDDLAGALIEERADAAADVVVDLAGAPRALAPRVRALWRIGFLTNGLVVSALAVAALVLFGGFQLPPVPHLLLACVPLLMSAFFAWRLPARRYDAWRYRLTDDALRLDRGVMFRVESVVPYTRIQHVDTAQGPVARALGLMSVTVHTASGSDGSLSIPGLLPEEASALREQLATLAGVVEPL